MKELKKEIIPNIICFSHLRWDFVFQRPHHLMSRFAKHSKIYFMEEPVMVETEKATMLFIQKEENICVMVPQLPHGLNEFAIQQTIAGLLKQFFNTQNLTDWTFWYYTPLALSFSEGFIPGQIVYDCMDELSAFKFAPVALIEMEKRLLSKSDIVFTGGHSLYEAKKNMHANIWPVPSSIDHKHWASARKSDIEPADQRNINGIKIGFFGVIDERFDLDLIKNLAESRPDWNIILIGPVVKIDGETLPKNANIHYLGQRNYKELPQYLSGWQVALIPFAINESTKFISPTKTPEYLAAGIPVVSTPIRDVVIPYGVKKIVHIASDYQEFIQAIELILKDKNQAQRRKIADVYLSDNSWDKTFEFMFEQMVLTKSAQKELSIAT